MFDIQEILAAEFWNWWRLSTGKKNKQNIFIYGNQGFEVLVLWRKNLTKYFEFVPQSVNLMAVLSAI